MTTNIINKKLGYYSCNDKYFSSKIEACIYSNKLKYGIFWHFNDREFNKHDWTVEPELSLDQLYDRRSRELRENYDYIILSYSGGADSNNVLESFLRQKLHIDEILVQTMSDSNKIMVLDRNNISNWNNGAEHQLHTVPRLQYIKDNSPRTKITVVDTSKALFNMFNVPGDESWILNKKEVLNPAGASRYNYLSSSEIRNRFDKNKKIAVITGSDKPKTVIVDNVFYFLFVDKTINATSVQEHLTDYTNATVENFYWHPDSAEMLIKQSHVVKRWLQVNPQYKSLWTWDSNDVVGEFEMKTRLFHECLLRNVIYTTWDNNWFQTNKSASDWFNEFDTWFYKDYQDTKEFAIWQAGLDYVNKQASNYIKYKNEKPAGLKIFTKQYTIGTMSN